MANILTEGAEMLTKSLTWGGKMTFDQINKLDWLKTTSYYGINLYIQEGIRKGWINYYATRKGRKMSNERE